MICVINAFINTLHSFIYSYIHLFVLVGCSQFSSNFHLLLIFQFFSGQGDTVVSILIDLNGFWTYENREVLVADSNEEAEV